MYLFVKDIDAVVISDIKKAKHIREARHLLGHTMKLRVVAKIQNYEVLLKGM